MSLYYLTPNSDESVSGTWSGSTGTRYTAVNDWPDDTISTYIQHGTTAGNICFGFTLGSGLPAGSTVSNVSVAFYQVSAGSNPNVIGGRLKVGGNYYNHGSPMYGTLSPNGWEQNWISNPKTSLSWTQDDINGVGANALQAFGLFSSDANPRILIGSIRCEITYTAGPTLSCVVWVQDYL